MKTKMPRLCKLTFSVAYNVTIEIVSKFFGLLVVDRIRIQIVLKRSLEDRTGLIQMYTRYERI